MTHILVVDKDQILLNDLNSFLTERGYQVSLLYDGWEAIEACSKQQPEIILCEIIIPRVFGTEVCSRIKETSTKPVAIILMSEWLREMEDFRIEDNEYRADDYILKPFEKSILLDKLDRLKSIYQLDGNVSATRNQRAIHSEETPSVIVSDEAFEPQPDVPHKKTLLEDIIETIGDENGTSGGGSSEQPSPVISGHPSGIDDAPSAKKTTDRPQTGSDRRYDPRVPINISVTAESLDMFVSNPMVNLSKGGIFLRTSSPLALGTRLKLEFLIPGNKKTIKTEGVVVWSQLRPTVLVPAGMGVRFAHLKPEDEENIRLTVRALQNLVRDHR